MTKLQNFWPYVFPNQLKKTSITQAKKFPCIQSKNQKNLDEKILSQMFLNMFQSTAFVVLIPKHMHIIGSKPPIGPMHALCL